MRSPPRYPTAGGRFETLPRIVRILPIDGFEQETWPGPPLPTARSGQ
ncbi:hypothetical protein [Roseimaritima sediminicola]|nr:hypothetical protein [Roseimaritima sediminicola]